jgi:hypothetical protein
LTQIWPDAHAWPQLPQLVELLVVSTHVLGDPQSFWPTTGQLQLPPLQVAPAGHWLPQEPQLRASFVRATHAPPEQSVSPNGQTLTQMPVLQVCDPEQVIVQLPQWLLSEVTQALPQKRSPVWH